ncbi:MAG TPA: uracil phosphoribosyltransferase [Rhabdochlamydiaceae bacterium]|nr:uracil phosphoribosyltransferase [Rhabdochlamydiaceae bacterium]
MKDSLLSILRDKSTNQSQFRKAADKLARLIAAESAGVLGHETIQIETPLGPASGYRTIQNIVLIPILRSGIALLPAFLDVFDEAQVGFIGIKRDEATAQPYQYYESIPEISENATVFILDPMVATGGSAVAAIKILLNKGASPSRIFLLGIIASSQGIDYVLSHFPEVTVKVVAKDKGLNEQKYIVPGLGDFGNRYFGIG